MERPAVIFDFGNVVAYFDYRRACERFAARLGMTGDAFLEELRRRGFSGIVARYERGALSSREFSMAVCKLIDLDVSDEEFAAAWSDIFCLNEPVAGVIAALKRGGYTLVLGSNTNDLHATQFRRQFAGTLAHFDRLVLSYEVGHIKPAVEFYHACAAAAGRAPGECVFIDDLAENVAGARAAGLRGIQYRDVDSLLDALETHGICGGRAPADGATQSSGT